MTSQKTGDYSPATLYKDSHITQHHYPPPLSDQEAVPLNRAIASTLTELEAIGLRLEEADKSGRLAILPANNHQPLGDLLADHGWVESRLILDKAYNACDALQNRLDDPNRRFEGPMAEPCEPLVEESDDLPGVVKKVDTAADELRRLQQGEPRHSMPSASLDSPVPPSPDEAVKGLKNLVTEHSGVKIIFFPVSQEDLARQIADLFELAGWPTNFSECAQEPRNPRYVKGIEVSGVNSRLIDAVASALEKDGIRFIKKRVTKTEILRSNPKYQFVVESIRVTVGHTPNDR